MSGKTDELEGRMKEAYGDLTDDEESKDTLDDAEDWPR
jgi:uncharacterized protein YjbJ (UPF0337 family)